MLTKKAGLVGGAQVPVIAEGHYFAREGLCLHLAVGWIIVFLILGLQSRLPSFQISRLAHRRQCITAIDRHVPPSIPLLPLMIDTNWTEVSSETHQTLAYATPVDCPSRVNSVFKSPYSPLRVFEIYTYHRRGRGGVSKERMARQVPLKCGFDPFDLMG